MIYVFGALIGLMAVALLALCIFHDDLHPSRREAEEDK